MDRQNPYFKQVELLVSILPIIGTASCFALKGGTAINLFFRDMPRLSVDIDLVYLPIKDRNTSLVEISQELMNIGSSIGKRFPKAKIRYSRLGKTDNVIKLTIQVDVNIVKIELSPVLRGTVYQPQIRRIRPIVEATFGFAEVPLMSFEDVFAGKIVAALDRQHPRDLFDVKLLLENEGITHSLKQAFLVYLMSHNRTFLDVLNPTFQDIHSVYDEDFVGMTVEPIPLVDLEAARVTLVQLINRSLTEADKRFLLEFNEGKQNWTHFDVPHIKDLPAIKWKLQNLEQMKPDERRLMIDRLREHFRM